MVRILVQGESMKTRIGIATLGMVLGITAGTAVAGGERTNIQGMGMARTFVASSRGLDAVGINPANLAAPDRGTVTIGLMPLGFHVGSDFLNYGLYKEYFTGEESGSDRVGRLLTDQDKRAILASFPDGTGRASAQLEIRPIALSVYLGDLGTVALSVTEYVNVNAMVPHDYAAFLLYGNPPGSTYDFSSTAAYATWLREYAVSYGRMLPCPAFLNSLSAGLAVKIVHGFGYFEIDKFNTKFVTGADGVLNGVIDMHSRMAGIDPIRGVANASYQPFPAPAGTGWGIDLGVASDITEYLRAGMSITDIGSVEWTRNLEQSFSTANVSMDDPLNPAQRDSLENAVRGERGPSEVFSSSLPTTFRLGAAVELHKVPALKRFLWGEWLFACDYNLGMVEGAGTAQIGRFSMGLEFKPWGFLPLRTGASFGGPDHFNFAFGFGLHFGVFDLDFASEHLNFLFSEASLAHGSIAMGMRVRI
jgi:hypothetical protein